MHFYSGILFEDREQGIIVQQILTSVKLGYKFVEIQYPKMIIRELI